MGRHEREWLDCAYILRHFSSRTSSARTLYRAFVENGITQGKRDDLTGGGLIKSNKGWRSSHGSAHRKGDERILGSSDFVLDVLKAAGQSWEHAYARRIGGIDWGVVNDYVATVFDLSAKEILLPGKYPNRVAARSVFCYFLVRELGMTTTAVADRLGMGQPAISLAVRRGESIVKEKGLSLQEIGGK
jgi:putative transposase